MTALWIQKLLGLNGVDMHLHLGKSRDGAALGLEGIQKAIEDVGLKRGVIFPIDEPDPGPSYFKCNNKIAQAIKKDKRLIGFFRLNPHEPDAAAAEIKRSRKLGFRGVKLHPRSEDFTTQHVGEILTLVEKERYPVVLHTSHESHCHPVPWEGIFLRHKKISFILAHAGKDAYREAAAVAGRCKNVFLDTSTLSYRRTGYLLQKLGPGKIVFASDFPYSHPRVEMVKFELLLKDNDIAIRKIFEENPKRILGDVS